jgi:hypothetical protein
MRQHANEPDPADGRHELALPDGATLLRQLAAAACAMTGATRALIVQRLPDPARGLVVGSAGEGAPQAGTRVDILPDAVPGRTMVPLSA